MATQSQPRQQVEFPTHERPHTEISVVQMLGIAAAFTLVWFGLLYVTPITKANFIRDLFLGGEVRDGVVVHGFLTERLIFQGMITFVWALSMATVILKVMTIKKERATLEDGLIPEGLDLTESDKLIEVYERIRSRPNLAESLGLTRVARVLAMWINTGDFERTAEYARSQSDMDALASDASFRRNRLFIWAMPLLGFVGTVFGVAAGIGGSASLFTPSQGSLA